ncbi:MAG: dTDP-4-amino-4,6-dideoxygalactose transaminase [Vicinamibacterales bacterium]
MTPLRIPFNRVVPVGREFEYMQKAVAGTHISGAGPFTRACEELLARELDVPRVLLTTSCTHALEMSALLLDIGPGDEVILPSFTFVSTVNAFVLRGARPVFVDIRNDSLNIDEDQIGAAITPRTKAIVLVHYAGVACELEPILALAESRGVAVIEDNAHGLFGRYRGRRLGTFGRMATLSFHETKNISCGEGGALILNDPVLIERAEILREKGTDRSRFFRGEVDKYTWVDLGSSYVLSDLLAAFLLAQLEGHEEIQRRRCSIFERYDVALSPWARSQGVGTLTPAADCEHPAHMYYLRLPDSEIRRELMQWVRDAGALAVSHYMPLHLSPMGLRYGYKAGDLPVTEKVSGQILRLPFFASLDKAEQETVTEALKRFDPRAVGGAKRG